tara:strand:+ start:692 stop:1159 length:468 start_codon:yes stop_codon:yes gene_type:complete
MQNCENGKRFIDISFIALIIILVLFYIFNIIKTKSDYFFATIGLLISLMILISNSTYIIDIAHFFLFLGYLIPIAIVSKNKNLLILNTFVTSLVLFSRQYHGECILNVRQKQEGYFSNLSGELDLDWDILLTILFGISTYRLVKLFGIFNESKIQ